MFLKKRIQKFSNLFPLLSFEHEVAVLKDGRVAFGFELIGKAMEKDAPSQTESYNRTFALALASLPLGTIVQRYDLYYHHNSTEAYPREGYFSKKFAEERPLLFHKAFLILSLGKEKSPTIYPINTLYSLGKGIIKNPLADIESRIFEVEKLAYDFVAQTGLRAKKLTQKKWTQLFKQYLSLEFATIPKDINRQICPHPSGLSIGEKQLNILSLASQARIIDHSSKSLGVSSPYVSPLTHYFEEPHLLITTFKTEDTEKELKRLDTERKILGSLENFGAQDHMIREEEMSSFTDYIRRNGEKLLNVNLSVILWDSQSRALNKKIQTCLSKFGEMGAKAFVEAMDTTNLFFSLIPGNGGQIFRWTLMPTEQASAYQHNTTLYYADLSGMLLHDRFENPLKVDLFSPRLNNRNGIVIGPTGSGKSFTVGNLIIQRYEQKTRQIIIDLGGTYKNMMSALGGKYFEYNPENPLSFNPMLIAIQNERYWLSEDKLVFLSSLFATIWKKDAQLTKQEEAVFTQLLPKYYQSLTPSDLPLISDFCRWLKAYDKAHAHDDEYQQMRKYFDLSSFLLVMEPFCQGKYATILNSKDNIDISAYPLVCFDMAGIKENPSLYPIISLLITELALDQLRLYPQAQKYIYMDEAWSMLSQSMGGFVEKMYRTIRKNNGAIYIITQGISEIQQAKVGEAIVINADIKIILNHSDLSQITKVGEVLGLTDHELDKIRSLRKIKTGREIFIRMGDEGKIFMIRVPKRMAAILSSTPHEREAISQLIRKKKGRVSVALDQYFENLQKPHHNGSHH